MTASERGINIIKAWETLQLQSYLCPAGVWTIGWGTTRVDGKEVRPNQKCSREEAERYLRADIAAFEHCINAAVKVPLWQNQFDALCSLVYNIGCKAFRDSTLLRKLNAGDYKGAAEQFQRWNKANGRVLEGLVKRRAEEHALFELVPKGNS